MKPELLVVNCKNMENMEELILYISYGRLREVSMSILHASVRKKSRWNKIITLKRSQHANFVRYMIAGQRIFSTSQRFGRHGFKRLWWNQLLKHCNLLNSTGCLYRGLYWCASQAAKPE